jgi:hypothetical protein
MAGLSAMPGVVMLVRVATVVAVLVAVAEPGAALVVDPRSAVIAGAPQAIAVLAFGRA